MYNNILCAIDVTSDDESVINKARVIADQNNANLNIVHVIEYSFLPKGYQHKLEQQVMPRIQKLGEEYSVDKKNRFVKFGQAYIEICELEKKLNIDLVVLGSHGKHGIKAILGSTANATLQQVGCDVTLVKLK